MNIYTGTIGQLLIIEFFVFWIWFRVFTDAVKIKDSSMASRRLLITSLGLVLNSIAIAGIMSVRLYQFYASGIPYIASVVAFYVVLAISNFMFLISACLGKPPKLFYAFLLATVVWTAYVMFSCL